MFMVLISIIPLLSIAQTLTGKQPNLAIDPKGVVRMVYGSGSKIYCSTSTNKGETFSKPVLVADLPDMHLGSSRGPQIASSNSKSVIVAIDKPGEIHAYKLNHQSNKWVEIKSVNDRPHSAPEGLIAVTADNLDNFYTVWLDVRLEKMNNVFFSSLSDNSISWHQNQLVYKSPEGHTCECCKPNIIATDQKIAISFRNYMMGARDIYFTTSINGGKSFSIPQKAGSGTWPLEACPMDGGGIAIDKSGAVTTAWRRKNEVFLSTGSKNEIKIGTGRNVSSSKGYVAWQDNNQIKVYRKGKLINLGQGVYPRIYSFGNKAICVFEEQEIIKVLPVI